MCRRRRLRGAVSLRTISRWCCQGPIHRAAALSLARGMLAVAVELGHVRGFLAVLAAVFAERAVLRYDAGAGGVCALLIHELPLDSTDELVANVHEAVQLSTTVPLAQHQESLTKVRLAAHAHIPACRDRLNESSWSPPARTAAGIVLAIADRRTVILAADQTVEYRCERMTSRE
jgi:hypothetical protein